VGHDLPRRLRADAARRGRQARLHAPVHDLRPGRRPPARQALPRRLGVDPKRFTPRAVHNQISDAKNKLRDAEDYSQLVGSYFEQTVAEVYALYERELTA
jgi:DNA helicase-2/ATP-dependent DNA helicase PcrA